MRFFKFYKYNFCLLLLIVLFYVFVWLYVGNQNLKIHLNCEKIEEDELSCRFRCILDAQNVFSLVNSRVIVTHSGWAAIYDKVLNNSSVPTSVLIDLPRRNYNYVIRAGIYDGKNMGSVEKTLPC